MKTTAQRARDLSLDIGFDIAGCGLLALGTQVFNAPNNIAPGGVSGIAILLNYLYGLPIAAVNLAINLPLLLLAFFFLGRRFTFKTMKTVLISTVMLTLVGQLVPVYHGERILAALSGGVLYGVGLALVFTRSSTTGGADILVRLIQKRYPDMAVGRLFLVVDLFVLVWATMVYRNLESALFALVGMFTRSQVMDSILFGLDKGKVMMIVTSRIDEIAQAINEQINRGCTLLEGKGSYTRENRPVLLVVVRKNQYYELKKVANAIDPACFIISMEADEVIGKGFKAFETSP